MSGTIDHYIVGSADRAKRIEIVLPHLLFADLLADFLRKDGGYDAIARAQVERNEALMAKPELLIIDHSLYHVGKTAENITNDPNTATRTILLTDQSTLYRAVSNLPSNICGLIPKQIQLSRLLSIVNLIASGETFVPLEVLAHDGLETDSHIMSLSTQERHVLRNLGLGYTNNAISAELGIKLPTVKMHVSSVLKKLGCQNRAQAAIYAREKMNW